MADADPCPRTLDVVDRELHALRELIEARLKAHELAAALVAETVKGRFEQSNEWRAQLDRERIEFVRMERLESIVADLKRLEAWHERIDGGLLLVRFLAVSGTIGLVLTVLRMIKALP